MPGIAELALGAAPIAGGALLGITAGNLKAPDIRGMIKQDLDLLDRLPPEQTQRRANLQRYIDMRVDDLITAGDRSRALREAAASYRGNWRDVVLFICSVLFTVVWWHVSHSRTNWMLMFIVMILLSIVTGLYAARGVLRALQTLLRDRRRDRPIA
jgi:ABC-type antimicrobial peptide transport system permease subunit